MQIFVDADACPVVHIIEKIAKKYQIAVTLLCDTNHILDSEYSEVMVVGAGADAVDYKLISICHKGDIVVSQDYGVAAICLSKKAAVMNPKGHIYNESNIDRLLEERHISQKIRKGGGRTHNNPKKRTSEDDKRLKRNLIFLIEKFI